MKTIISFTLCMVLFFAFEQNAWAQKSKPLKVFGKVIEKSGQQPVEFATIMVANQQTKQLITGTTTKEDGSFELEVDSNNFYIEISFIGFKTQKISNLSLEGNQIDVGTIELSEDGEVLEDVVVRAEKSQMEFKLDKKVFNVGKDLSSTGASALELLNNVPSVDVNIEGQVSLRGTSGVQILINGKPSILASDESNALGTITADMVEKIEVVTNPSAKYDAEGTAGIINIVLKKEERKGVNGSISLNTGYPHNHSIGFSLNQRTEKFNLFSQIGAGYRSLPRNNENINRNLVTGTSILSDGVEYRNETFFNVLLGADYHINDRNVLTLSGNFAYEIESQPSQTNFKEIDNNDFTVAEWYRKETTGATNPKGQYELIYKGEFKDNKEHTLQISALGNFFSKAQNSEFENITTSGNLENSYQQTNTAFKEARYTFQADYVKPFGKKVKMELGSQYVIMDISNDYAVSDLINDNWVLNQGLTNVFEYDQKVLAFYGTGSYEDKKWGVKIGLRVENTDLRTFLVNTNEANNQNYTNLFPSAHASYKINERFSMQAGYSRRIFRPRLWDLNPFFNIRNNFTIRSGNPDLLPEFTDSYELTGIYILDKLSLNLSVYHRYTTAVIERVSTFENNVNTFMPMNIGQRNATGVEFNAKYTPLKWLTINGDFNYNYFSRQGTFGTAEFDFKADQWSTKLTTKFQLPYDIDFELMGDYRSKYKTVQSTVGQSFALNLGVRKKLLKGKAVISLSVRDLFATRVRETEIEQEDFYIYSFGQRGRFITLGFSYGFGKGEAMEYSGGRRR
ncbi:outer membrane beta-barrel family protein [Aureispira sp. CCB-E]|uniref:outer membrane beta-barrel family protein n=1 Tax=Aureispira sp. CCB-E TaxID=3051121 RepID=UPI002868EEA0|nr:outer membrane beta-barrel family protein [Aureispira sp. CCB-E]WMX14176.1 outer membrane beta-barrel family protein [Aureispira sp. CCB-E]